uniref:Uncharacterized protein n=1 Tax=Nymphaea colorata TaxID=210225 RepID=A0A5K1B3I7_9MAGN
MGGFKEEDAGAHERGGEWRQYKYAPPLPPPMHILRIIRAIFFFSSLPSSDREEEEETVNTSVVCAIGLRRKIEIRPQSFQEQTEF